METWSRRSCRCRASEVCRGPLDTTFSRETVVHRVLHFGDHACGYASHRRRSFIASTSSLLLDRVVFVATQRQRWQVDFRKRAFSDDGAVIAGLRRSTDNPTGRPEGCRSCPTDRILGRDRRAPSPISGITSSATSARCLLSRWRHREDRETGHAGCFSVCWWRGVIPMATSVWRVRCTVGGGHQIGLRSCEPCLVVER
jgi:hypothetical protein